MTAEDHVKKANATERAKDAVNAAWEGGYCAGLEAVRGVMLKEWEGFEYEDRINEIIDALLAEREVKG